MGEEWVGIAPGTRIGANIPRPRQSRCCALMVNQGFSLCQNETFILELAAADHVAPPSAAAAGSVSLTAH
jgi:hypothetical protein